MQVDCFPDAPREWLRCALGAVAEVNPNYRLDKAVEYPFVEMAAVGENFRGIQRFEYRKPESSGLARFKLNDILFAKITPSPENGKVALVRELPNEFGLGSTEFIVLSPKDGNDPRFVYALVCSNPVRGRAVSRMEGSTGRLRVTEDTFRKWLAVPVPQVSEQRALADIFEACNEAIANAEAKLTAARRLKTALMQQLFTRGIPGQHTQFRQTKIGEIPAGWEVATIKSVLESPPFNGVSPQSRSDPPGTPILNVACINDGVCTTKYVSYVDVDEQTAEECRARKGDFYVLRGNGNREYVATGGLLTEEPDVPTIFSDKLIRLRFQPSKVVERFIPYLWQSSAFLRRLQSKAESGSGLWMFSKRDIRRQLFAYPPCKDEQQEIVALIDRAIENVSACQAELNTIERLKQSLLQNFLTGRVRVNIEP